MIRERVHVVTWTMASKVQNPLLMQEIVGQNWAPKIPIAKKRGPGCPRWPKKLKELIELNY